MKKFKCPFCNTTYLDKESLYAHMEEKHDQELCGLPAAQVYFNYRNRYALTKGFGKSVISGKPTAFNLTTERYERFANDEEKQQYRELFRKNMIHRLVDQINLLLGAAKAVLPPVFRAGCGAVIEGRCCVIGGCCIGACVGCVPNC